MLGIMTEAGPFDLLFLPMLLTLYTGAYIMRGLRLLVMYNPHLRKRWGWCVKETASMRALVASWVVLEVIIWAATILFGVRRSGALRSAVHALFSPPPHLTCRYTFGRQLGGWARQSICKTNQLHKSRQTVGLVLEPTSQTIPALIHPRACSQHGDNRDSYTSSTFVRRCRLTTSLSLSSNRLNRPY